MLYRGRADIVALTYRVEFDRVYVRPERPTTDKSVTLNGKPKQGVPVWSDLMVVGRFDASGPRS